METGGSLARVARLLQCFRAAAQSCYGQLMFSPRLPVSLLLLGLSTASQACGGSASETPPPLEPKPEEIERGREAAAQEEAQGGATGSAPDQAPPDEEPEPLL